MRRNPEIELVSGKTRTDTATRDTLALHEIRTSHDLGLKGQSYPDTHQDNHQNLYESFHVKN